MKKELVSDFLWFNFVQGPCLSGASSFDLRSSLTEMAMGQAEFANAKSAYC